MLKVEKSTETKKLVLYKEIFLCSSLFCPFFPNRLMQRLDSADLHKNLKKIGNQYYMYLENSH